MSEVRNAGGGLERFMEQLAPLDHDKIVTELAALMGRGTFDVVEGAIHISVPVSVAFEHVRTDTLVTAISLIHAHACLVARAAAVMDHSEFADWSLEPDHLSDAPGHLFEFLADRAALRHAGVGAGDDVEGERLEDGGSLQVLLRDAPCQKCHEVLRQVAENHLVRREACPVDHPEPLVPRRSTPPP